MTNDVTRRDAFKVLATGAAGAVIGGVATPASGGEPVTAGAIPSDVARLAYAAARKAADELNIPESHPACLALVSHCRSWSGQVYLYIHEQLHGFVTLTASGFALASSCVAANRPLAVRYWGYDPQAHGGAGEFAGAVVALEVRDLPGQAAGSIA